MRARLTLFVVATLCLFGTTAPAQPLPGEIGLFPRADGTGLEVPYAILQPFEFYVVATPPPSGIKAWEASFDVPPDMFVLSVVLDDPLSINVGNLGTGNLIVGLGNACAVGSTPIRLATIQALFTVNPGVLTVCLGPSDPSSVGGQGPAYSDCANQISTFALAVGGWGQPGCVQIGGFCGAVLPSRTFIDSESAAGDAGTLVAAPLNLFPGGYLDCPNEPWPLTHLEVDVQTDSTVAVLESVDLTGLPAGWTVTMSGGGGSTHLVFAGTTSFTTPWGPPTNYAQLNFRMSGTPGQTDLDFLNFQATGPYGPVPALRGDWDFAGPVTLTSQPVAVESINVSRVKAMYGRD